MSAACASAAMVLAAGLGTRLGPLTTRRAKSVVPFLNRPFLDYTLEWLRRCGFREVVINLHHRPDSILRLYGDEAHGLALHYSHEERLLGTAGGPRKVLDRLGERPLLINGDVATRIAPGPLAAVHEEMGALATLLLRPGAAEAGFRPVRVDDDGRILAFGDVPGKGGDREPDGGDRRDPFFAGVHLVERRVLDLVPPDRPAGIVDPVYRHMLRQGLPLCGVVRPGVWYEIGTPRRYLRAQLRALARRDLPMALHGYDQSLRRGYLRPSVRCDDVALLEPFLLGDGVVIGTAARAAGVVAGPDCRIGPAADLEEVVLWARSRVGAGARLRNCVVMNDVAIEAGSEIVDAVVTPEGPVPMAEVDGGAPTGGLAEADGERP